MTTPDPYQPHVYIDHPSIAPGPLSETKGLDHVAPIRSIEIVWGAPDWYTDIDPAILTLDLIDPRGDLIDIPAGTPIRITRDDPASGPDSVTVYRGTITAIDARYRPRTHPETRIEIDSWDVTLTATDPLGELAADRRHGQTYPARELSDKHMHWGPCTLPERETDLEARAPAPIFWPIGNWPTAVGPVGGYYPVACYEKQQNVSVLTVLRQTAKIHGIFARPSYYPDRNEIRFDHPTLGARLYIHATTGELTENDFAVTVIPASRFALDDGVELSSGAVEQINTFGLELRYEKHNTTSTPTTLEMSAATHQHAFGDGPQSTFQVTADLSEKFFDTVSIPGYDSPLFEVTFGMYRLPVLSWRPDPTKDTTDLIAALLNPAPPLAQLLDTNFYDFMQFYPVGAITSWSPRAGGFAVVGGTLNYDARGWEATLNPASVFMAQSASGEFTLADLSSSKPIGDFPDHYRIADFTKLFGQIS